MSWVAVGVGAVSLGMGAAQKAKAKKMAKNNIRPVYQIQQEVKDNSALASSEAADGGISDATRQLYNTGADRGLSASIGAILKGGGSVNNIADIYDNYQGGISKLALVAEEGRAKKIADLVTANNAMAGEKDKEWQLNKYAPWADTAQAAAALSKQGSDNEWKGINTIGNGIISHQMGQQYKLKDGTTTTSGGTDATGGIQRTSMSSPLAGWNIGSSGLSPEQILAARSRAGTGSGIGTLDPIEIDGVLYDPQTMQPIN